MTRLFDFLALHCQQRPQQPFLSHKVGMHWQHYTFAQIHDRVLHAAQYLRAQGIARYDKVAIIASNCPAWNIADLAIQSIGAVTVPMYPTISEKDYVFIFKDAQVKLAFVGDVLIGTKIRNILPQLPDLQQVVMFEPMDGFPLWDDCLAAQQPELALLAAAAAAVEPHDLATIIYTSGTTGFPKGVMLSHHNIISNLTAINDCMPFVEGRKALSFLPLCHSFERAVFFTYLSNAVHVHYAQSLDTIADNLKEVKPYCFTTVPRLLEKIYDKIIDKGNALTGLSKRIFDWAMRLGAAYELGREHSFWYGLQLRIARKLVFSKWRDALGGEVAFIVTGAAPFQVRLAKLFTAAGISVLEGYGLTETSPVLAVNRIGYADRRFGSVGVPLDNVTIRIAEDGEILAKGPNIMKGYFNRPDLTDEVIDPDGWFHTGDIGEMVEGKFLKITDRKKELFKTSGGKYIAPQAIENKMKESRYIEQIMVVGEHQKFVSALIVPAFPYLYTFAQMQLISYTTDTELIAHPAVLDLIRREVDQLNTSFGKWEQIKQFALLPKEWSVESGELTPTFKPKRKTITANYNTLIQAFYHQNEVT